MHNKFYEIKEGKYMILMNRGENNWGAVIDLSHITYITWERHKYKHGLFRISLYQETSKNPIFHTVSLEELLEIVEVWTSLSGIPLELDRNELMKEQNEAGEYNGFNKWN